MFLYYIPGDGKRPTRPELQQLGLGYALAAEGDPDGRKSTGPGDATGFLLQPGGADEPPTYKPEQQTWRKGPAVSSPAKDGQPAYWVGFWTDRKPTEASLRREKFIAGEAVKLRDGGEWVIPIARSIAGGSTLPRKLVLGEDNQSWRAEALPEFRSLCKAAERVYELLFGEPAGGEDGQVQFRLQYDEAMGIVLQALAVNYRLSIVELGLLELFTDDEIGAVFRALIDFKAYRQMAESRLKKDPASASSPSAAG